MSLILRIGERKVYRVISKLRNPLETGRAESPYHGRIHIRVHNIRRIEFINHPCFLIEFFHFSGERNVITVYVRKEIPLLCLSGYEPDRIPLIGSSLNSRFIIGFCHISVVTYIIKYWFTVSRLAH